MRVFWVSLGIFLTFVLGSHDLSAEEKAVEGEGEKVAGEAGDEQAKVVCSLAVEKVTCSLGDTSVPIPIPGPAVAVFQHKTTLYVALGRQGGVVYDLADPASPRQLKVLTTAGEEIVGFVLIDGEVWTKTVATRIVPVGTGGPVAITSKTDGLPKGKVPVPSKKTKEKADAKKAKKSEAPKIVIDRPIRILSIVPGKVTLDVGAKDGVEVGDYFSVFKAVTISGTNEETFEGAELAAVVEVIAVNEKTCLVRIWRGDRVSLNDRVELRTSEHKRSHVYPRHLTHLAEVAVTLRPILNVEGPIGFGALNDVAATYYGRGYFVSIRLHPLAFAFTHDGDALVMNGAVEAGYDARAFAIGVGVGLNVITYKKNAFSIAQSVRLGTRDGLNLVTRNVFSLRKQPVYDWNDDTDEEELSFEWSGISSRLSIPLTGRTDLFFEGGGSENFAYGEGGVHAWLIGNGDAGSLGLAVAAGAAAVFADNYDDYDYDYDYSDDEDESVEAFGPMVSLGLKYRFGFKRK